MAGFGAGALHCRGRLRSASGGLVGLDLAGVFYLNNGTAWPVPEGRTMAGGSAAGACPAPGMRGPFGAGFPPCDLVACSTSPLRLRRTARVKRVRSVREKDSTWGTSEPCPFFARIFCQSTVRSEEHTSELQS